MSVAYGIFDYSTKEYYWVGSYIAFTTQADDIGKFIGSRSLGADIRIHNDATNCPNEDGTWRVNNAF